MSQTINIKDISGYNPNVYHGYNFGHPSIIQATYHFSYGSEVAFYNLRQQDIGYFLISTVAVWRIKQLH